MLLWLDDDVLMKLRNDQTLYLDFLSYNFAFLNKYGGIGM